MNFGFSCFRKLFCCFPQIYAWGASTRSQFGSGLKNPSGFYSRDVPVKGTIPPVVTKQSDWIQVINGGQRCYGILSDGGLWGWGAEYVGDGSVSEVQIPTLVDQGPWKKVAASPSHTCGIKTDGSLWQWGHQVVRDRQWPYTDASLRAKLSAPIGGAVITTGGKYSKTPTVAITTSDVGSGATATAKMAYTVGGVTLTSQGKKYKSKPTAIMSDGTTSVKLGVSMDYSIKSIRVTNGGGGYTSAPAVTIPYGMGVNATASVTKMGRLVTSLTLTDGGSGYLRTPMVLINGTPTDRIVATVDGGQVVSLDLLCSIKVDTDQVNISFLGTTGSGAAATATSRMNHVVEVAVSSGGSGYAYEYPAVRFTTTGGGYGASAAVSEVEGKVSRLYQTGSTGSTFKSPPVVTLEGGDFEEAATAIADSTGVVEGIEITNAGAGYTANKTIGPFLTFTRQDGDSYTSSYQNNAEGRCYLVPSPISSIQVVNPGTGYSTYKGGTVSAHTLTYFGELTEAWLQAGTRKEQYSVSVQTLGPTGATYKQTTLTFSGSTGWPYSPTIVGMQLGMPTAIRWVTPFSYDGIPHPLEPLDVYITPASVAVESPLVSGFDAVATASANVSDGSISSVSLLNAGESYVVEPSCSVSLIALRPRRVGTAQWKDVACGTGYSVAIGSDSLLYRWGTTPNLKESPHVPVRLGKRVVASTGALQRSNVFGGSYYYYNVTAWIAPPDSPGDQAIFTNESDPQPYFDQWRSGGVAYGRFRRDENGQDAPYGTPSAWLKKTGFGYTSVPEFVCGEGVTLTLALHGPDQCKSVHVAEGSANASQAFAIDTNGKLWCLNADTYVPHGTADTVSEMALSTTVRSGNSVNTTVTFQYEPTTSTDFGGTANTYMYWYGYYTYYPGYNYFGQYAGTNTYFYLTDGGQGYGKKITIKQTGQTNHWWIVKTVTESAYSDEKNPGYYRNTETVHDSGDFTEPDVTLATASSWHGSVFDPWMVRPVIQSTFMTTLTLPPSPDPTPIKNADGRTIGQIYTSYSWRYHPIQAGSIAVIDESGTGSGAAYEYSNEAAVNSYSRGFGPAMVGSDKTWTTFTADNYAVDSSGKWYFELSALRSTNNLGMPTTKAHGRPLPAAEQREYVAARGTLAVDDEGTLRVLGRARSFGNGDVYDGLPSTVQGDVELTVSSPGIGYTEPASVKFSEQPEETADISSTIDGKVDAVAVTFRGLGYNSPPTVSLVSNDGVGSGAVAVGKISGPVYSVKVTSPGSGYRSAPRVSFSQPGMSAEATCSLSDAGGVSSVSVSNGGTYRSPPSVIFTPVPDVESVSVDNGGDGYSSPPTVVIVSDGGYGSGASASSVIDGKVVSAVVYNPGFGFTSAPGVEFISTDGGIGSGAAATAIVNQQTGELVAINITSPGTMYQKPPQIRLVGGGGTAGVYSVISGPVSRVDIKTRGSDYRQPPLVFFTGGGGSGASATATTAAPGSGAVATARINGELIYCDVTEKGSGYQSQPTALVTGGDNEFIDEAQAMLARGDITEAEYKIKIKPYVPTCLSRISGEASFAVVDGGAKYGTAPDRWVQAHARASGWMKVPAFRTLGPDINGTILGVGKTNEQRDNNSRLPYRVNLATSSSNPPGGAVTAISSTVGIADARFTSPPQAVLEDTYAIRARTSMRICGVGLSGPASARPAGGQVNPYSGTYAAYRLYQQANDPNSLRCTLTEGNWYYAETFATLPELIVFRSGGTLGDHPWYLGRLQSIVEFDLRGYTFEELPTIYIESELGSGAEITVTDKGGGVATAAITNGGSGYGTLTRARLAGGKTKVTAATASAVVVGGRVVAIDINNAGAGYTSPPRVLIHGGGGYGAEAVAYIENQVDYYYSSAPSSVKRIDVVQCGGGYTSTPTVTMVSTNKDAADTYQYGKYRDYTPGLYLKDDYYEFLELSGAATDATRRLSICAYPLIRNLPASLSDLVYLTFDDGFLDSVTMDGSFGWYDNLTGGTYLLREYIKRLPASATAVCSGNCDTPAAVSVVRPRWSSEFDGQHGDSNWNRTSVFLAVRDTTQP
jgi:hypothetical protein